MIKYATTTTTITEAITATTINPVFEFDYVFETHPAELTTYELAH